MDSIHLGTAQRIWGITNLLYQKSIISNIYYIKNLMCQEHVPGARLSSSHVVNQGLCLFVQYLTL